MREHQPGVWEVRIVVGFDDAHRRSIQRSFTVRGDRDAAEIQRADLARQFGVTQVALTTKASRFTLGELLSEYIDAPQR